MAKSKKTKVKLPEDRDMDDILNDIEKLSQEKVLSSIETSVSDFVDDNHLEESNLTEKLIDLVKTEVFRGIEISGQLTYDQSGYICDAIDREKKKIDNRYADTTNLKVEKALELAELLRYEASSDTLYCIKQILGEYLK